MLALLALLSFYMADAIAKARPISVLVFAPVMKHIGRNTAIIDISESPKTVVRNLTISNDISSTS
jgi:hypothetical protein